MQESKTSAHITTLGHAEQRWPHTHRGAAAVHAGDHAQKGTYALIKIRPHMRAQVPQVCFRGDRFRPY